MSDRTGAQASRQARWERLLALHGGSRPLLLPNAWDPGSARLFEWLGFEAVGTTSSGMAAANGRLDGTQEGPDVLAATAAIAAATSLPVSADLEHGFGDRPEAVAATVRAAGQAGLAGCSIEDATGRADQPIYERDAATERVAAAVEAARSGPERLVLTARAENHLHGVDDLEDTIGRLQSFQEAGADVLFAPGLTGPGDIARLVAAVDRPVNVLARPGGPSVDELAALGVARVSVGGAFCFAAVAAVVSAATELRDRGTYGFWEQAAPGAGAAKAAFGP